MSATDVRVHGRDFTTYRIIGAIAALILFVALLFQVWELFDGDARTVPEVRWGTPAEVASGSGATLASTLLVDRTALQDERFRTGPSPDNGGNAKIGPEVLLEEARIDDPDPFLTDAWSRPEPDALPMLRGEERVIGSSSLPYVNANLFERPFGRDWRLGIADIATHLGALAILGMAFLLALVLAVRGRVPIAHGKSGRKVKRFGLIERATHWMTSVSFIMLALTGIVIAYGDTLIRPFGEGILGSTGYLATWGHAIFFPSFALGIVLMAVMWMHRNLPSRLDLNWFAKGGGFFVDSGPHPSARKFNAGQKLIFWAAILGGALMVASGVTLLFPFYWLGLGGMSWAMLVHAVLGLLLISVFIAHIYIGSVGMQGAFWAMWGGEVDRAWAEQHHDLWLAEIENRRPEARS